MSKTLFLFSGQGCQFPGMGKELLEAIPSSKHILEVGSKILGYSLEEMLFTADEAALAQTCYSQPAIFTVSLLAWEAMKANGIACDGVAGHSLGEYAAMVAAGVVSMEDGFALIQKRAAAMQECAEQHPGCMAAILTSDTALIEQTCADADGYVVPANYNSNAQTVIAGEKSAVNAVCETLSAQKIRCVPLAVSAAFHTRLMQSAADAFQTQIKNFAFSEAKVDFFSNVTGKKHTDFTNMPSYLSKQIVSPVRFTSELQAAKEAGYDTFLELGPGKVLTGLVRKTLKDVSCQNVSDTASLAKALTLLQK